MDGFWVFTVMGFVGATVYGSFFEWAFHRFVMHRPLRGFDYPFRTHALTHHQIFKADHTYHVVDPMDRHKVPMAWWNGPALVAACSVPFLVVSWVTGAWG